RAAYDRRHARRGPVRHCPAARRPQEADPPRRGRRDLSAFADQVLPVDTAAAEHYVVIASSRERAGKPIAGFDALIAAVCRSHGATLATRNVSDFGGTGIEIIDPWLQSPG